YRANDTEIFKFYRRVEEYNGSQAITSIFYANKKIYGSYGLEVGSIRSSIQSLPSNVWR
nr:hypothetical protein [Tanacetum cinerariifolium]